MKDVKYNILITSAGKRVALTRYFKESLQRFFPAAKVFTTDMNPELAPAGYVSDACFKVPRVTDPLYLNLLLKICENNHIGLVIPTIDTELLILSSARNLFKEKGIEVIVGDLPFISMCRDKRNTGDFFYKHNVRVPKEIDKHNPTFPIFAKPYDGSLSTNLHYIKSAEDLTSEILTDPKLIFMEYIDKSVYKEYTVDMYYGFDNKVKCIVPRERIEIRAGEINKGRTTKNDIVQFLKEHFSIIDGCIGCICVQLFYNVEKNDIIGIEINPRFGGGYPLTYMAGANFPELLIREYLMNENVGYVEDWKDGMLMLRYDDAIYI